jgi:nitrite reductase/ring-hydroxylating ferredoxin subunit
MTRHLTIGPLSAIPKGEGRTFTLGTFRVAVFHGRDGRVFATQAECPHQHPDGTIGLEVEEDGAPPPWRVTDYSKV